MEDIVLIGGGGHCVSVIDVIEKESKYNIVGILDGYIKKEKVLDYPILGGDELIPELSKSVYFLITVGQIKSSNVRKIIADKLNSLGSKLATIVSPLAYVSKHAIVGEGTIIMHHALVNAEAQIGHNCIINSKANIEHGAEVQNFCHIATGATINGNTIVKEGTFIGSNTTLSHSITIKENSIISAGKFIK